MGNQDSVHAPSNGSARFTPSAVARPCVDPRALKQLPRGVSERRRAASHARQVHIQNAGARASARRALRVSHRERAACGASLDGEGAEAQRGRARCVEVRRRKRGRCALRGTLTRTR
jgi:hypothetical protein